MPDLAEPGDDQQPYGRPGCPPVPAQDGPIGQGLGGGLALLIAFLVGAVQPFITSHEVGELCTRRGWRPPVSGLTGLWYFPGVFILVGPLVWFIQTNGAINDNWKALGAR